MKWSATSARSRRVFVSLDEAMSSFPMKSPGCPQRLRVSTDGGPSETAPTCDSSPALLGRWVASEASEPEGPSGLRRRTQSTWRRGRGPGCCGRPPTLAAPLRHLASRDATSPWPAAQSRGGVRPSRHRTTSDVRQRRVQLLPSAAGEVGSRAKRASRRGRPGLGRARYGPCNRGRGSTCRGAVRRRLCSASPAVGSHGSSHRKLTAGRDLHVIPENQ